MRKRKSKRKRKLKRYYEKKLRSQLLDNSQKLEAFKKQQNVDQPVETNPHSICLQFYKNKERCLSAEEYAVLCNKRKVDPPKVLYDIMKEHGVIKSDAYWYVQPHVWKNQVFVNPSEKVLEKFKDKNETDFPLTEYFDSFEKYGAVWGIDYALAHNKGLFDVHFYVKGASSLSMKISNF